MTNATDTIDTTGVLTIAGMPTSVTYRGTTDSGRYLFIRDDNGRPITRGDMGDYVADADAVDTPTVIPPAPVDWDADADDMVRAYYLDADPGQYDDGERPGGIAGRVVYVRDLAGNRSVYLMAIPTSHAPNGVQVAESFGTRGVQSTGTFLRGVNPDGSYARRNDAAAVHNTCAMVGHADNPCPTPDQTGEWSFPTVSGTDQRLNVHRACNTRRLSGTGQSSQTPSQMAGAGTIAAS